MMGAFWELWIFIYHSGKANDVVSWKYSPTNLSMMITEQSCSIEEMLWLELEMLPHGTSVRNMTFVVQYTLVENINKG